MDSDRTEREEKIDEAKRVLGQRYCPRIPSRVERITRNPHVSGVIRDMINNWSGGNGEKKSIGD